MCIRDRFRILQRRPHLFLAGMNDFLRSGEELNKAIQVVAIENLKQHRHLAFDVLTFELEFVDVQVRDHACNGSKGTCGILIRTTLIAYAVLYPISGLPTVTLSA